MKVDLQQSSSSKERLSMCLPANDGGAAQRTGSLFLIASKFFIHATLQSQ